MHDTNEGIIQWPDVGQQGETVTGCIDPDSFLQLLWQEVQSNCSNYSQKTQTLNQSPTFIVASPSTAAQKAGRVPGPGV